MRTQSSSVLIPHIPGSRADPGLASCRKEGGRTRTRSRSVRADDDDDFSTRAHALSINMSTIMRASTLLVAWTIVDAGSDTCSGRGERHSVEEGVSNCVCWGCFAGADCQSTLDSRACTLIADSSAPALAWGWWRGRGGPSLYLEGGYRPGDYLPAPFPLLPSNMDSNDTLLFQLSDAIRTLHASVGNAVVQGYHVVVGVGASQLLPAAMVASAKHANGTLHATARPPYYPAFRESASLSPGLTRWVEAADAASLPPGSLLEWLTIPNNPDGAARPPLFPKSPHVLADLVYYWPSLVAEVKPRNDSVMVFSLCKLAGFCPVRFGWALVRDAALAEAMRSYVMTASAGPGVADVLQAIRILRALSSGSGCRGSGQVAGGECAPSPDISPFFAWMRTELARRWSALRDAIDVQAAYFALDSSSTPGALYAWIRCTDQALARWTSCAGVFATLGVLVNEGGGYSPSSGPRYARLVLAQHEPVFDELLDRLRQPLARSGSVLADAFWAPSPA